MWMNPTSPFSTSRRSLVPVGAPHAWSHLQPPKSEPRGPVGRRGQERHQLLDIRRGTLNWLQDDLKRLRTVRGAPSLPCTIATEVYGPSSSPRRAPSGAAVPRGLRAAYRRARRLLLHSARAAIAAISMATPTSGLCRQRVLVSPRRATRRELSQLPCNRPHATAHPRPPGPVAVPAQDLRSS
jgi:hypothetical protein